MPFVNRAYDSRLSDLLLHERDGGQAVGFSRDSINVTPPAASAPVLMGTVVFRTKTIDNSAAWTVLAAAGSIVDTNEFAVVFGDHYAFRRTFVPNAIVAGEFNALAFTRSVQLKDYFIKQVHSNLTSTQWELLRGALRKQGILVQETL